MLRLAQQTETHILNFDQHPTVENVRKKERTVHNRLTTYTERFSTRSQK